MKREKPVARVKRGKAQSGSVEPPLAPPPAAGQCAKSFRKSIRTVVSANYLLYLPPGYRQSRTRWPLLMFLHGAGERGVDLGIVARHGPPRLVSREGRMFPFVMVSPQCPGDGWWSSARQIATLGALLDTIEARYRIDRRRIYVTGLSMGGFGTWGLAAAHPHRFAAIVPICGGGHPREAASIAHLPVWVFHGARDDAVPLARSQEMVAALKQAGGKPRFTVYPAAGHDSWTATYAKPALYRWLLQQRLPAKRSGKS
jgi:predicted peptidase